MPRLIKAVPKYRKHKQSGQAIVTLGGRDHLLGPHGTKASKVEYDRLIIEWLQNGRQAYQPAHDGLTVMEIAAAYIAHARDYYRKRGVQTSEYACILHALRPLKELYGRHAVTDFGPRALKAVRQRMVAAGLSRGVVNQNVGRIRRMFRWAVSDELIPAAISDALESVTGLMQDRTDAHETEPVLPANDAVVDATLAHLPAVVADMVRLQRFTGMRPAEVCLLRPCDVDRTGDVWLYRPRQHKTEHRGRRRLILIGPKAQGVLLRYLARDAEAHCFRPCDSEAKRRAAASAARVTPMSCGNRPGSRDVRTQRRPAGQSYSTASYRRAITRACEKAKVAAWAPNQLRHSTATDVRAQFGLEAAQVILGHAKADITEIYAERDMSLGVQVARAIG